jgi:hypothetical protein
MKTIILICFLLLLVSVVTLNAQLTGEWTDDNGSCYKIRQIENQIYWFMDGSPRVLNVFTGYIAGNTITGRWADLPGGNIQGSGTLALRIESQNRMVKIDQTGDYGGSVWTRGSCQKKVTTAQPNLDGVWYDYSAISGFSGKVSYIKQDGNKLAFTNSFNDISEGSFIDNTTIIANKWEGGLKATLEDNNRKIVWKNGSIWERSLRSEADMQRPNLDGIWYDYSAISGNSGKVSYIKQDGNKLIFTNSFNSTVEGSFIDNTNIIANGWEGGLKATLEDNGRRIVWKNGSVWQRTKR